MLKGITKSEAGKVSKGQITSHIRELGPLFSGSVVLCAGYAG